MERFTREQNRLSHLVVEDRRWHAIDEIAFNKVSIFFTSPPHFVMGLCTGGLTKNTMGIHESLKRMEKVFTSIITTENTNRKTKLIFNFIIKGLK